MKRYPTKSSLSLLLAAAMLLALMSGCGPAASAAPPASQAASQAPASSAAPAPAPAKDSLVFAFIAESKPLDPAKVSDTLTYIVLSQVFDTLVRIESDGTTAPWLAESWTVSPDGKEVLFKIKKDVKFHDGTTMTTEDVAYSLNRTIASPNTQKFTGVFSGAEVVDDSTVKVLLKNPYAPFLYCIGNPCMAIVSKAAAEKLGDDFAKAPVGTGAYKYVDWVSGQKMTLTRFDDWWHGAAAIKDITLRFITDTTTAAISLEKGEVDVLFNPSTNDRTSLMDNKELTYYEWPSALCYHIDLNNGGNSVLKDPKLREAISYAINREDIVLGGLNGIGEVLEFMTPPSAFGYNPDFRQNEYNPQKAKQLLAEAGYPEGTLNLRIRCNETSSYANPCEVIQEQLRQVGINSTVDKLARATYLEEVTVKFDYDLSFYVITALIPDADYTMYTRTHSSMLGAGNNYTQINLPALDTALNAARVSQDPAERMRLYTEANQILKDNSAILPVCTGYYAICADKDLKGVGPHSINFHYMYDYSW